MLKFYISLITLLWLGSFWGELLLIMMLVMILLLIMSNDYSLVVMMYNEIDWVNKVLIILSVWIIILSIFSSVKIKWYNNFMTMFSLTCVILLLTLIMSFSFSNYLLFYMMFELSLIPTFFLILGWGYQPERIRAGIYMFFYTFLASLPLLMTILWIKTNIGHDYFFFILKMKLVWTIFFVLAFMMKFPMYMVHLWLPKAHVEAPVAGSMILAGILLKLGGYGLIRMFSILMETNSILFIFFLSLSLWGGIIISLNCLRMMDMKSIIAYSSVVHMGLCLGGLLTLNDWGLKGSMCVMVGHGLCSAGLFFLANLVYERTHSRSMIFSKGMMNMMPSLSLSWFLLLASNMAAPPTVNLLGEINLFISMINWEITSIALLSGISFFSAAYSLYLFSMSQHGESIFFHNKYNMNYLMNHFISFLHWSLLGLLIMCTDLIM
uniref:NADH-ubiquinone oxidoreductase chain 4 n=1 Tax=Halice sp. JL-2018 TaxID=2528348 RepID=A0A3Q8M1T4_9CRUS|nr:NADH dehydrogenase subunit 4 [Halice sp. JL-2018]